MRKISAKKYGNFGISLGLLLMAFLFQMAPESARSEALATLLDLSGERVVQSTPTPQATTNSTNAAAVAVRPTVVKVADGDTITVKFPDGKEQSVRLLGVDTPETVDPRKTVQCFGRESSEFTKTQLLGKEVVLEPDATQGDVDRYNRLLRYVYTTDGSFFNLQLLQEGYATEYTYQKPYSFQKLFIAAQAGAKADEKGLWNSATCNGKR